MIFSFFKIKKPIPVKFHFIAILVLQVSLCFLFGYNKIYNSRPFSIHQWRQTDCASIAKNYFEENNDFLHPSIHWQGAENGRAVSEFPLINYTVAQLWKIFGEKEVVYRILVLLIYFSSMHFLFYAIFLIGRSALYSYFSILIVLSSPVLAYYSFSFLADIPALSFSIIALSLFIIFIHHKNNTTFYLSVLFATLATLLKASSATVLLITGIISLIDILNLNRKFNFSFHLFKNKIFPILAFLLSGIIIISWYRYAFIYNGQNSNGVFLMETLPIWKMNGKVIETARLLYNLQLKMFLNKGILFCFGAASLWLILNRKKVDSVYFFSFLISGFCFIAFIILFYQVFNVHDYYLITSMIFPIIILLTFANYLRNSKIEINRNKIALFLSFILLINITHTSAIVRLRNSSNDNFCQYYPFISNEDKNFSDWFHYNYEATLKPLETITPYLRSLGIKRNDFVVSIPDPSFNISLYLMDQKGFTETEQSLSKQENKLIEYKSKNAKYIIISDINIINLPAFSKIQLKKVGNYKNIVIYKIQ
jgi:hypothetical protein